MNKRQKLTQEQIDLAVNGVIDKLKYRMVQKGMGTMASCHEILGIISQEVREFDDAVHQGLHQGEKIEELKDIAVGAIFGIASIASRGVDW